MKYLLSFFMAFSAAAAGPVLAVDQLSSLQAICRRVADDQLDLARVQRLAEHLIRAALVVDAHGSPRVPFSDQDLRYYLDLAGHEWFAIAAPILDDEPISSLAKVNFPYAFELVYTYVAATMTTAQLERLTRIGSRVADDLATSEDRLVHACQDDLDPATTKTITERILARVMIQGLIAGLPTYRPRAVRMIRLLR